MDTEVPAAPAKRERKKIPWDKIEAAVQSGEATAEISARFGVAVNTINAHIRRHEIVRPTKGLVDAVTRAMKPQVVDLAHKVAKTWIERGEAHREVAFERAAKSVALFKPRAPRNFRELEAADKVARRAAGLETADVIQQTLVNVNEAIDAFEAPREAEEVKPSLDTPLEVADVALETVEVAPNAVEVVVELADAPT